MEEKKNRFTVTRRGFLGTLGTGAVAVAATSAFASTGVKETAVMDPKEMTKIKLRINGTLYRVLVEPRWSLLFVLRGVIGLTAAKEGCGRGECGACTVLIDQVPRYACLTLAVEAEETEIVTPEGLMEGEKLGPVQQAFLEHDAFQCGSGTGGAYPAGGTSLVDWLIRDLYTCPNVHTEATDIFVNAGPARPFRAPGHPQGAWALEQMLDALAATLKMDPVELRLKNIPTYSQAREGNPPYTTTGLRECLEQGARAFRWKETKKEIENSPRGGHLRRGVGVASCLWFVGGGGPPSTVIVKLFSDGSVNLNMGASDIGTGTKTVMAMVVSEELGVKPDLIQIEHADTGTTQYATPSGGSKTVPTEAPAVRSAAIHVKQQLLKLAGEDLGTPESDLRFQGDTIASRTDASKKIQVTKLSGLRKRGVVVGVGYRGPNPQGKVVNPFAAQFCEVEVNTRTGEVKLLRFLGANESGRVMDRLTFDNQVYGGITMGVGLAMTEMRVLDGNTGKMVNKNWHDYKLPTALDVPPEMVSLPIELPDPEANNTGAKGLGEPVTIPTAAAIANAVYHATGVRVTETPINPYRLSALFAERLKEE